MWKRTPAHLHILFNSGAAEPSKGLPFWLNYTDRPNYTGPIPIVCVWVLYTVKARNFVSSNFFRWRNFNHALFCFVSMLYYASLSSGPLRMEADRSMEQKEGLFDYWR